MILRVAGYMQLNLCFTFCLNEFVNLQNTKKRAMFWQGADARHLLCGGFHWQLLLSWRTTRLSGLPFFRSRLIVIIWSGDSKWCAENLHRTLSAALASPKRWRDHLEEVRRILNNVGNCGRMCKNKEECGRIWNDGECFAEFLNHSACFREIALSPSACSTHYSAIMAEAAANSSVQEDTVTKLCWWLN